MGAKSLFAVAAFAAAMSAAAGARAEVIGFDDLPNAGVPVGYHGLNWEQLDVVDASNPLFDQAVVSPTKAILQAATGGSFYTANGDDFTFVSAWMTGSPRAATDTIQVLGYLDGVLTHQEFVAVLGTGPTLAAFNWTVDRVRVNAFSQGGFLDDVTVTGLATGAVPEPSTWALVLIGFGGLGTALRRRRQAVCAA